MFGLSPDSKPSLENVMLSTAMSWSQPAVSVAVQLSIAAGRSEVHVLSAQDRGLLWNHWYTYLIHQGSFTSVELCT